MGERRSFWVMIPRTHAAVHAAAMVVMRGKSCIRAPSYESRGSSLQVASTPKEAGAPNNYWSVTLTDVKFTGYTLTVEQDGQTVLTYESPEL
jgi:hypothetical protein